MPAVLSTDRPNVLIRFRGDTDEKRQLNLRDRLLDFKYRDREKGADICILTLENHDLSLYEEDGLRIGNILEVTWGYPANFSPTREVLIKKSGGFRQLKIEAYDLSCELHKKTKCRTFKNKKRSQVVQQIAEENGFKSVKQDIEDTGEVFETLHQARQTDAQFMNRLAEKEGFQWYIDFDGFHYHQRRLGQKPQRSFRYYNDQERGEIISIDDVDTNIAAKGGAITVAGRNSKTKKTFKARANNESEKDRDSMANVIQIVDPESSNTRIARRNASEQTITTAQQTETAAKKEAKGRYKNTQLSAVKLKFTVIGDPGILAKTVVVLIGIGKLLSGRYTVTEAEHVNSKSGYKVQLTCKRDGVSERGPLSKGQKNRKNPDGKDVRLFQHVDPETLKTQLQFIDSRGRTVKGSK